MRDNKKRCLWVGKDPLSVHYHDVEWGVPVFDDQVLFEFLVLEGMQAGLSWLLILKKRDNYRKAFDNFNAEIISKYKQGKINNLLKNQGIIRNKLKIQSVVNNARAFLETQKDYGTFASYIWQFVKGRPLQNFWKNSRQIPTRTLISDAMSKGLKNRGFKFVGSTICYAYMQAVGMVNDHLIDCFRHRKIKKIHYIKEGSFI